MVLDMLSVQMFSNRLCSVGARETNKETSFQWRARLSSMSRLGVRVLIVPAPFRERALGERVIDCTAFATRIAKSARYLSSLEKTLGPRLFGWRDNLHSCLEETTGTSANRYVTLALEAGVNDTAEREVP
jgi:hypothetical protein